MMYHSVIPLGAAVACLALAIFVNRSGPQKPSSQVFTFLASMLVLWNLNFFVLYSVSDLKVALDLTRVFRVGALFVPPAVLHLVTVLGDRRSTVWRTVLVANYALACGLAVANGLDLFVAELRRFQWGYYSVGTRLYNVFSILVPANLVAAFGLLIHDYHKSEDPRTRLQFKFWLLGAGVAFPLGCTNLLPTYGIPVYPLGNLGSAAWAGIVAYAIARHRLMDIDLVVTKGMAYIFVASVLIAPAFAIVLWLQRLSFGQVHPDFSASILVMLVAVGVLFPALRFRAESRIERSLFREKHEYRVALMAFTRSIVRILDRQRLLRDLANTLSETLRPDRVAVAVFDEAKRVFSVQQSLGVAPVGAEFPESHPFVAALTRCQDPVLREELEVRSTPTERAAVSGICKTNAWDVCIPLTVGGKLIGFIGLGRKRELNPFFTEDLVLLATLAAEASVALENARLYDELKRSQDIIRRADRLSALGTLAAGIAHEVRNPLVSIQTFFQLAPERLHDEEFFTTFLGMTANEVKRISDLITELLSFARSPTRQLRPMNLNDAVERVATLLEPEARKHHLKLGREFSDAAPMVLADADQIKQVLINLVLNAIQATQAGGVVTVVTRTIRRGDLTFGEFEVNDTGMGIPQERLEHIFDPFFTTKDRGTGLGLSIAHQIIMEHGGLISVDSKEGRGTSFVVDLPWGEAAVMNLETGLHDTDDLDPSYQRPRKIAL
jgi:two-component system NtrC family sensor kinase